MAQTGRNGGRSGRSRPPGPGRRRPQDRRSQASRDASAGRVEEPGSGPRLSGRSAVVFVVLAVLFVSYATSIRVWFEQRSEIQGLEAEIAERKQAVEALREEKRRWEDPAFIEAQARERFGWVLPGEIGFRVLDENGDPLEVTSELTDPQDVGDAPGPEWWDKALRSVRVAGAALPTRAKSKDEPARRLGPGADGGRGGDAARPGGDRGAAGGDRAAGDGAPRGNRPGGNGGDGAD
ncbi:MAG: septum formation initiator family protein [Propionibacteriales bacterium]|nr:septum formation initiator family protein [Propionibacteriales bacterium]